MSDRLSRRAFLTRFARKAVETLADRLPELRFPSQPEMLSSPTPSASPVKIFSHGNMIAVTTGKIRVEADSDTGLWNFLYDIDPMLGLRGAAFGTVVEGQTILSSDNCLREIQTDPFEDDLGKGMEIRLILTGLAYFESLVLIAHVYEGSSAVILQACLLTGRKSLLLEEFILLSIEEEQGGRIALGEGTERIYFQSGDPEGPTVLALCPPEGAEHTGKGICVLCNEAAPIAITTGFLSDQGNATLIRVSSREGEPPHRAKAAHLCPKEVASDTVTESCPLWLDIRPSPPDALEDYGRTIELSGLGRSSEDSGIFLPERECRTWNDLTLWARRIAGRYYLPQSGELPFDVFATGEYSEDMCRAVCTLIALSGRPLTLSDDRHSSSPLIDLIPLCLPPSGRPARPIDLFRSTFPDCPRRWSRRIERNWGLFYVVGLLNPDEDPQDITLVFRDLGFETGTDLLAFEFWEKRFLGQHRDFITLAVPATDVRVLALHPIPVQPIVLATDMHLSMGGIELTEVLWNYETQVLTGGALRPPGTKGKVFVYVPPNYHFLPTGDSLLWEDRIVAVEMDFGDTGEADWQVGFTQG